MTPAPALQLAYYGDDFTGSTDALERLARAGWRTVLFLEPPTAEQRAHYGRLDALGVAGRTRSLSPAAMETELRPALEALRALAPRHVHYKVCSTFDSSPTIGSIGRAIDVAADVFASGFVPVVVGAPALGRYCVFGQLFARMGIGSDGAIHRLDRHPAMMRHPVTPADEADLRIHLARQTTKRIELFDILQQARPLPEAERRLDELIAAGAEVVLFDVLEEEHLRRIGRLLERAVPPDRALFSVGSSAIESALTAAGEARVVEAWRSPGPVEALLVVSGSCSPISERQIEWAQRHGFAAVELPAGVACSGDEACWEAQLGAVVEPVVAQLRAGTSVIVHTLGGGHDDQLRLAAARIGAALGHVADQARQRTGLRRLLIAGGDTSSYVARALRLEAIEMIAPLAPGAPLCRVHAPGRGVDGLEINVKGGQVGEEDYFAAVVRGTL